MNKGVNFIFICKFATRERIFFQEKIYTVGNIFTRPPDVTVAKNFKSVCMYVFEEKSRRRIIPAPSWREPAHLISLKAFHCCRLSHHLISTANNKCFYESSTTEDFKKNDIAIFCLC